VAERASARDGGDVVRGSRVRRACRVVRQIVTPAGRHRYVPGPERIEVGDVAVLLHHGGAQRCDAGHITITTPTEGES
jgi:hypothetical protein